MAVPLTLLSAEHNVLRVQDRRETCAGYTDRVVGLPERSPRVLHLFSWLSIEKSEVQTYRA